MATKWTTQQAAAISARENTLLISAAAGSGKTAVLIERIMQLLIDDGAAIDRMLIVTFTRAAASEMQQRLYHRLSEEIQGEHPELMAQLDLLPQAQISTIHGFCQKVLRSDFQAAGIDPLARIGDSNTCEILFQQSMEDAMNALLEENEECFGTLMESFTQTEIFESCKELYHFMMAMPEPFAWLREKIRQISETGEMENPAWSETLSWMAELQQLGLKDSLQLLQNMLDEPGAMTKAGETVQRDAEALKAVIETDTTDMESFRMIVGGVSFARMAALKPQTNEEEQWKKSFQKRRNALKDLVKELNGLVGFNKEKTAAELVKVRCLLEGTEQLVQRTHALFAEKKNKRALLDFSDLEQMTLNVLMQDDICEKVRQEYDHIFVDECQDVSAIQYAILQKLHDARNCLFMVGDVKQSIYRFRLADPTLILGNMKSFQKTPGGKDRTISLQTNFRSTKSILEATNLIFRKLMDSRVTELDYEKGEELIAPEGKEDGAAAELYVITHAAEKETRDEGTDSAEEDEQELLQGISAEAAVAAEQMYALHERAERPYAWREMVILMPKVKSVAAKVAEQLQKRGIPVYCDEKGSYFDLPEITAMVALLKVMDDPMQDLPLMTTLKLPGFQVTDAEMADIRLLKSGREVPFYEAFHAAGKTEGELGEKCRRIAKTLADWRFRLATQKVSSFLWEIMEETGYYAIVGAMDHGEARQANLRLLCQRVMEYEQVSDGSLMGFLTWQEEMRQSGDSTAATLLGDGEDLVRIMTIHKSKGLQFPVVFALGMGFGKGRGRRSRIRCHRRLGVLLPYVNAKLRIRRDSFPARLFDGVARMETNAERVRLLYVAMTRAQEKLVLVGSAKNVNQAIWVYPAGPHRIDAAGSMLDWVMQALLDEPALMEMWKNQLESSGMDAPTKRCDSTGHPQAAKLWNIKLCSNNSSQAVDKNKVINNLSQQLESWANEQSVDELWRKWQDIYAAVPMEPLKTSVSAVVKQALALAPRNGLAEEETPEEKRVPETIVSPLRMDALPAKPRFLQKKKLSGAERGTLMHKALSLTELSALKALDGQALRAELGMQQKEWVARQLFTKEESEELDIGQIASFYEGELGQRILCSGEVRREWSFNLRLSHDKQTILQGVMDCAFREGNEWVLVDYKTDHVEDKDAFIERYEKQLQLYARALEEIRGERVKELWLYAIGMRQAIRVPCAGEEGECAPGGVFL